MDIKSLIAIVIAIIVIYFFIRLIVSPILKAVVGIIIFLFTIYLLQRFFGFNIDNVLSPFGISLGINKWSSTMNWILNPAYFYIDQIKHFITFLWGNVPKSAKPN